MDSVPNPLQGFRPSTSLGKAFPDRRQALPPPPHADYFSGPLSAAPPPQGQLIPFQFLPVILCTFHSIYIHFLIKFLHSVKGIGFHLYLGFLAICFWPYYFTRICTPLSPLRFSLFLLNYSHLPFDAFWSIHFAPNFPFWNPLSTNVLDGIPHAPLLVFPIVLTRASVWKKISVIALLFPI